MHCIECHKKIPEGRLEILPDTKYCVNCAAKNPEPPRHDPNIVCAQASPSGQNGFSVKS